MGKPIMVDSETGEVINNYNRSSNYRPKGNYSKSSNDGPQKKHSGAKVSMIKTGKNNGKQCIVFWNYSRSRGMVSGIATPYGGTDQHKSKNGRTWENWMVTLDMKRSLQKRTMSGLYEPATGKLLINDISWIVNPRAANGGYAGKFTK